MSTLAGGSAAAADGLVSPRAHDGGKLVYAVRRGPDEGIYDKWPDALDAGFKYKQGVGNGASFAEADRDLAIAWSKNHSKMQREARAAQLQKSIKEQHILIRMPIVVLIFTIFFFIAHALVEAVEFWYNCHDKIMKTHPICLGNMKVDLFMSEHATLLQKIVFGEVIAMMSAFFVWLVGCIA
ncbi:hypothetical protein CYMTET_28350 [Cymbomonas tetramitiformis]|uniref:Uncharacterized protein n=1 Tax=Cymbomonas tetramitiformis TaxID=36881 RepID=A0AAE0FNA3_9CHLO|nr:hypothetical protein CYMTET_28350 [Cymbomonas tetramitiformis]